MGGHLCTVFYIGDNLALTAGHCFGVTSRQTAITCSDTIRWGVVRLFPSSTLNVDSGTSSCTLVVTAQNTANIDYALLRLDRPAPSKLKISADPLPAGTPLQVLGYPDGPPMRYNDGGCLSFRADDTTLPYLRGATSVVAYKCDTLGGNSGSPVLRTDTWQVIGIHVAGDVVNTVTNDGWNWATTIGSVTLPAPA